jgi:hypothetical protein
MVFENVTFIKEVIKTAQAMIKGTPSLSEFALCGTDAVYMIRNQKKFSRLYRYRMSQVGSE